MGGLSAPGRRGERRLHVSVHDAAWSAILRTVEHVDPSLYARIADNGWMNVGLNDELREEVERVLCEAEGELDAHLTARLTAYLNVLEHAGPG